MPLFKNLVYKLSTVFISFYARLALNLDIQWQGPLPAGPKIFAANHPSATDPFLIHLVSKQPVSVCITESAFRVPILGTYMRFLRQISVSPGQGKLTLDKARQMMDSGRNVAIFPEGLISPHEGGFHAPRSGTARLAMGTGAPVIPVGISLLRERSTRISSGISGKQTTAWWYLRGPYVVTVGKPVQFEGNCEDHEQVRTVAQRLMESIHALAQESETRLRKKRWSSSPAA
jgi:1-acyl-sn-glycerol-3-phosphate acyltransferase